ncbi:MAG: conjugal transfer protein TraX [Lachnospiraceae bacterium]|nr:conjugal transfer protein TraX [Lachnospiraceae bacterium]
MTTNKNILCLSGAALKWIAIITMTIDHFAVAVWFNMFCHDFIIHPEYKTAFRVMRFIGRIAFPIFIFLIIEGYRHTRSRLKYLLRMLIFSFISEVPYDLAFYREPLHMAKQNVFFTLFIGLAVIAVMDRMDIVLREIYYGTDCIKKRRNGHPSLPPLPVKLQLFCWLLDVGLTAVGMSTAWYLKTDYSHVGVLAICIAWRFCSIRMLSMSLSCTSLLFSSLSEFYGAAALLPIAFYNGKRGRQIKYLFYFYYPAHLILFWLISGSFIN